MDYAGLKAEIALAKYIGQTDDQIAAALIAQVVVVTLSPFRVNGADIYNAIVPSEWAALLAAQQQTVRDIFSLGAGIDVSAGTNARAALLGAFGAGTVTRTNLAALVTVNTTRAAQLGYIVGVTDLVQEIAAARRWGA